MGNNKYKKIGWLLMLMWVSVTMSAQTLELLGVVQSGGAAQMKAKIDLDGKQIKSVVSYAFRMSDGLTTTRDSYELIDNQFITADVDFQSGDYAYRLVVLFTDGTKLISECMDADDTERFMWLGDLPFHSFQSGWDSNHPPRVDGSVDTSMKMILNDTVYHKGVSNHAEGYVAYQFTQPFTRFVARIGVQDDRKDGDVNFRFLTDGVLAYEQLMYGKVNPARGDNPCISDVDLNMEGVTQFRIDAKRWDNNNYGDHAHVVMARLYLPKNDRVEKEPQQIRFTTQGGILPVNATRIPLEAVASSGGKIYFRIIKGQEMAAIENGNELVVKWGNSGEIVVEAAQYGNDTYAPAYVTQSFIVDLKPSIEMLSFYPSITSDRERIGYLFVDTKGRKLTGLRLLRYNNAMNLALQEEMDLLPFIKDKEFTQKQVVEFPTVLTDQQVYQLAYTYEGEESVNSTYHEGLLMYDYMSDLPYTKSGTLNKDKAVSGGTLQITSQQYKKGFGLHAEGWVETAIVPGIYDRFVTDVGKQSGQPYVMAFSLKIDDQIVTTTNPINNSVKISWDYPVANANKIRVNALYGGDGAGNDHGSIGGARLYYTPAIKKEQQIEWKPEIVLPHNKPFKLPMQAKATSGLDLVYRIVEGREYATIEQNNILNIQHIPERANIIVEAYQPGDREWMPSDISVCTFRLSKGLVVQKDQRVELEGGDSLEELIVFADATEAGQVVVKNGVVNVKKMILKYTFIPKAWNFITFPTDLDLDKISNLNEKGYYLNNKISGRGAYYIRSYNTEARAENPSGTVWTNEESPMVKGLKGYIMGINNALGMDPVEITFTIDNVALDFESTIRPLNLILDLSAMEPGTQQDVYVKPTNVRGNTLKVNVEFQPEDLSVLPINHARALEQMRITYTPNKEGIRLTLPDQTPAKVAIYDKKGKKLIKAVRYVSPMMIDLTDMRLGIYQMVISYGSATTVRTFER